MLFISVVGIWLEDYSVYVVSKLVVEIMGVIFSKELCGCNIIVNVVVLGLIVIDLFLDGKLFELIEWLVKMNFLEWLGMLEDIVGVVVFLVGVDGGWINGQVLCVNGGMVQFVQVVFMYGVMFLQS